MQGFEDVTIGWKGQDYTVPSNRVMMLVCKLESILAGDDGDQALTVLMRRQGPPHALLACAYGAALRYAGADVSDDEVYLSMQSDLSKGGADGIAAMQSAIIALIAVISPPLGSALLMGSEKKSQVTKKSGQPKG